MRRGATTAFPAGEVVVTSRATADDIDAAVVEQRWVWARWFRPRRCRPSRQGATSVPEGRPGRGSARSDLRATEMNVPMDRETLGYNNTHAVRRRRARWIMIGHGLWWKRCLAHRAEDCADEAAMAAVAHDHQLCVGGPIGEQSCRRYRLDHLVAASACPGRWRSGLPTAARPLPLWRTITDRRRCRSTPTNCVLVHTRT